MLKLTPEQTADKMLRRWAARESALTGRPITAILREAGIVDGKRARDIHDYEVPFSAFEHDDAE